MIKEFFSLNYTKRQIENLLSLSVVSVLSVTVFSLFFISYILFDKINTIYLLTWLSCSVVIAILRIFISKIFLNKLMQKDKKSIQIYFKLYLSIIALSGFLWGSLFFIVIFQAPNEYIFFVFTLMFALSSGSIMTLGSVFLAVFVFVLSMSIPMFLALMLHGYEFLFFMGMLLIVFYLVIVLKVTFRNKKIAEDYENTLELVEQYKSMTDESSIVSKADPEGLITYVNEKFCKISGYTKEELVGKNHNMIRHPDVPKSTFKHMWKKIKKEKKTWQGIVKNKAKNGDPYYVSSTISPILDRNNNIKEYISVRHDITAIMSDKKQLFDYLEANKLSVLIMVQIEDYSTLEKFYDKATVEEIEKTFGDALLYLLPNECNFQRVYYLENGLFAFAKDRRNCQNSKEEIEKVLEELLSNIKEYVVKLEKIEYDISAICSFTYGVIQIYEDAKIGIEKAIEEKKTIVYADGLSGIEYAAALANVETLHTLKVALNDKKIISYFQPIVNNKTREISKYESLVRLIDENGNIVPPNKFLDIAKKGRYYLQVTKIVLENSFSILKVTDKDISVNLSVLDIESIDLQDIIFSLLNEYSQDSHRIVFELLESEDVKYFDKIVNFIKNVKKMGAKIAIDDFGSGYSNFERLLQYEPDFLKIDGSLIKNIDKSELSKNIVETIVLFAKKQNIKTVAEFVENEEIYNIVKDMGIDFSQGYAFGKPQELS